MGPSLTIASFSASLSFFGKPNEATSVPAPRRLVVKHQSSVNGADGAASFARFSTEQHQKYGGISAKRALSPFQGEEMPKHKQQKQQRPARMLSRSDDVICLDDEEEEPAKHKSRGRSTLKSCSNLNFDDKHFPPVCAEEEMQAASAGEFVREGRNLGTDIWSGQEITGLKAITAEEFLTEDEDENCGTEQICISESSSPQARGQKHKAARHQHAAHDEGKDVGEICSSQEEGEEEMSASSQGARPSMISVRQAKAPGRGWSEREEQANNLRRGGKRGEMSGMSAWHGEGMPVKKEQEGGAWIRKGAGCGEQIEGREPGGERVCREEDRNGFKNGNNQVVERRQGIGETGVTSLNCDGEELNSAAGANNIMMCCSASNTSAEAAGIMTDDGSKFYTESYDPVQDACWKSGEKCPYLHLARVYHLIEKERGRLKMGLALCNMFRSILALCPEDMLPAVYLTTGKLAPAHENLELSVGGSLISDAIKEVSALEDHVYLLKCVWTD